MSPQPSRVGKFPPEASGVEDIVFGVDPQSAVVIPKALIAKIWEQVTEGTRILSRGGLEIGGLLLGPSTFGGGVAVDEIVPFPIEYRHGPAYQMSSADLDGIAPAIESIQEERSKTVVGFYRGRTRGDTTLRESDHEIFEAIGQAHSSFEADFRCFLVLAPMSESVASACIRTREGGGWDEMQPFTLRSNPLSIIAPSPPAAIERMPRQLHTEEQAIQSSGAGPTVQPPTEHREPERQLPEPEHRAPEHRALEHRMPERAPEHRVAPGAGVRGTRVWLLAAACLAAVILIAAGAYRWNLNRQLPSVPSLRTETAPPRSHLGFAATREGPVWKLSWDRAAMDAINPIGAVLLIEDGGYQQQVPLEPADLASGTLYYTPQSNDLTFGLRVFRDGVHVEEQVRVLEAPRFPQKAFDRGGQSVPGKAPVQARVETGIAPRSEPPVVANASTNTPAAPAKPNPSSSSAEAIPTPAPSATKEPAVASTAGGEAKTAPVPLPPPSMVALAVPVPPVQPARSAEFAPPPAPKAGPPATAAAVPEASKAASAPAAVTPGSGRGSSNPAAPAEVPPNTGRAPSNPAAPAAARPAVVAPPPPSDYVDAKPIQQVRPQVPAVIPSGVTQVEVMVEIDVHGKVTKVSPIGWTPTNAPLMISAARAASSWVFTPAQRDGHAVPSKMNLIFRF
jgi:hypothetical protein